MTQCGLTVSDYTNTLRLIVYTCTLNFIEREESFIIFVAVLLVIGQLALL